MYNETIIHMKRVDIVAFGPSCSSFVTCWPVSQYWGMWHCYLLTGVAVMNDASGAYRLPAAVLTRHHQHQEDVVNVQRNLKE